MKNIQLLLNYLKKYRLTIIFIISAVLFLILIFLVSVIYFNINPVSKDALIVKSKKKFGTLVMRKLDGILVNKNFSELKPIAIIIDNNIEARPAVGLDKASIIYEIIAEGGVTRYLAIFDPREVPELAGPIRSIRPYYIDWAEEWDALLLHCGGSPEALEKIKQSPVYNLNEYSADGRYFGRDNKRFAPHNLFTSNKLIDKAILEKNIDTNFNFSPWIFKENLGKNLWSPAIEKSVIIDFFTDDYQVQYFYNLQKNYYERRLAGKPHILENGSLLKANNIVVQHTEHKILDSVGRLWVKTKGEGRAEIYQNGIKIQGRWENQGNRTRFYTESGEEISFNPGVTWIEVVFE